MSDKLKAVLLTSGGLDSTTLAYWLLNKNIQFIPLFINYGQHCSGTELNTLKKVLPHSCLRLLEIIDISGVYKHSKSRLIKSANLWTDNISYEDLYLPYRNLLLLSVAASYAQTKDCSEVYTAFINSNHAIEIDCSSQFFNTLNSLLNQYGTVNINMPFRELSKYEVAKIGINLKAPIGQTFSCQASPDIPCGACPNCVDRLEALRMISE